jgi:hypothetical protein
MPVRRPGFFRRGCKLDPPTQGGVVVILHILPIHRLGLHDCSVLVPIQIGAELADRVLHSEHVDRRRVLGDEFAGRNLTSATTRSRWPRPWVRSGWSGRSGILPPIRHLGGAICDRADITPGTPSGKPSDCLAHPRSTRKQQRDRPRAPCGWPHSGSTLTQIPSCRRAGRECGGRSRTTGALR